MKKTSEPIVFFGSGPVAAESLRLLARNFSIEAVITKPRAAHHRGDVPVITACEEMGVKILFADSRQALDILVGSQPFRSRLGVLIDFGIIVSQQVIDAFPLGIVNSHFSLLPQWRGADPITFSILSGQHSTGVSLMLLVQQMDEGPLLAQDNIAISPHATTPTLTADLIRLSDQLLIKTLPRYLQGDIVPQPQPSEPATYSRKLTKQDGEIDWRKSAATLEREIRAFIEWPKSRAKLGKLEVTITKAHAEPGSGPIGMLQIHGKELAVCTSQGLLAIEKLKPAGKPEMSVEAFLAGYKRLLVD